MRNKKPFPGTKQVVGLPANEYHAVDAWGSTSLKTAFEGSVSRALGMSKSSAALTMGTLAHSLLLEPEKTHEEVHIFQGDLPRKGSKARKELEIAAGGRALVNDAMVADASKWVDAAWDCPFCSDLLLRMPAREVSFFWTEKVTVNGEVVEVNCKARHDLCSITERKFADVKTADCAGDGAFERACANYDYWLQMHHYRAGAEAVVGGEWEFEGWLVLEKHGYEARLMKAAKDAVALAGELWAVALHHVAKSKLTGVAGYEQPGVVSMPYWYAKKIQKLLEH